LALEISLSLDIVAALGGLAILFYYFGKLILETQVGKEQREVTYMQGFWFTSVFIIVPFLISKSLSFEVSDWVGLLIQVVILSLLDFVRKVKITAFKFNRQDAMKDEVRDFYNRMPFLSKRKIEKHIHLLFETLPNALSNTVFLFLFSVTIFLTLNGLEFSLDFLPIFFILFTLLNLSILAIIFGYKNANYPHSKIYLKTQKKPIEGRILKFGDFICCVDDTRELKYFINSQEITKIEQSIFKNKGGKNAT